MKTKIKSKDSKSAELKDRRIHTLGSKLRIFLGMFALEEIYDPVMQRYIEYTMPERLKALEDLESLSQYAETAEEIVSVLRDQNLEPTKKIESLDIIRERILNSLSELARMAMEEHELGCDDSDDIIGLLSGDSGLLFTKTYIEGRCHEIRELRSQGVAVVNRVGDGEQSLFNEVGGKDYGQQLFITDEEMQEIYANLKPAIRASLEGKNSHDIAKELLALMQNVARATTPGNRPDLSIFNQVDIGLGDIDVTNGPNEPTLIIPYEINRQVSGGFGIGGLQITDSGGHKYASIFHRATKLSGFSKSPSPILGDKGILVRCPDITFYNEEGQPRRLNGLTLAMLLSKKYPGLHEVSSLDDHHHDQQYATTQELVELYNRQIKKKEELSKFNPNSHLHVAVAYDFATSQKTRYQIIGMAILKEAVDGCISLEQEKLPN